MLVLSDKEETIHKMEMELDDDERRLLSNYATDTISEDEYEELMIEWAIIDILKKEVGYSENNCGTA